MELEVYKKDGTKSGEKVKLSDDIFGIEPNEHAIYRAVRVYLDNQRQGTAKVKTREEVRGGGKKPFKQKGTGNARQGSSRSPVMVGGGSIFGPKPRDYSSIAPVAPAMPFSPDNMPNASTKPSPTVVCIRSYAALINETLPA